MKYAGFFTRFFALLIDNIAMFVLASLVAMLIGMLSGGAAGAGGLIALLTGALGAILSFVFLLFQFFYFGFFWSRSGQSIGMKMLNIKVVRRDPDGQISFILAGLRGSFGYWISGLVFGLGFIWAAFDAHKETWHDKIFDTQVIRA